MANSRLLVWWLLSLPVFIVACKQAPALTRHEFQIENPVAPLIVGLSDSAAPLEIYVRDIYSSTPDRAELQFVIGNDQTLIEQLAAGELDAAIVYRQPANDIFQYRPIAMDGLVISTHPDIQLQGIGLQTLQTLYSGTVRNWSIFDQANIPVTLFGREQGSGARTLFEAAVLGDHRLSSEVLIAVNEADMIEQVLNVPGALGYFLMASQGDSIALAVDGIKPTPETVTDESYPLSVPILLATVGEPSGDLAQFTSLLLSEEWQSTIGEKYGQLR